MWKVALLCLARDIEGKIGSKNYEDNAITFLYYILLTEIKQGSLQLYTESPTRLVN